LSLDRLFHGLFAANSAQARGFSGLSVSLVVHVRTMLGLRSGTGVANEGDLYRVLVESRTHDAVAHTRRVRIASCFTVWPIVWLMVLIP
jgi:hypothetical protein